VGKTSAEGKDVAKVIEAGLGSPVRIRIILSLARSREALTRYAINKDAGLSDKDAIRALKALVDLGWVEQLPLRPVKYRLNEQNEIVSHLLEFLAMAL
jgi:hypothetical protein